MNTEENTAPRSFFKIVLLGDTLVGKSAILNRFIHGKFDPTIVATLGGNVETKELSMQNQPIKLMVVDPAGPKSYKKTRLRYYEGANGCVMVYDITNSQSFENLSEWYQEYKSVVKERGIVVILGTKLDLIRKNKEKRQVTSEEGLEAAKKYDAQFYEVSAKDESPEIQQIFEGMTSTLILEN
ncbi:MAG: GTP-binding protein [Candidatus Heimdallarchaeota archaeon]|nr:MAG: GTP-binding protein [Candidatus Heimdallarchaeota archaeon]